MKTFQVCFKNGERITVQADGFERNSSGYTAFHKDTKNRDEDIYVSGSEILYIIPSPGKSSEPSKGK
jgi:hypothetical protein